MPLRFRLGDEKGESYFYHRVKGKNLQFHSRENEECSLAREEPSKVPGSGRKIVWDSWGRVSIARLRSLDSTRNWESS